MIARFFLALHRAIERLPKALVLPVELAFLAIIIALALAGAWILGGEVGGFAVALGADPVFATVGSWVALALAVLHLSRLVITTLRDTPNQEIDPA